MSDWLFFLLQTFKEFLKDDSSHFESFWSEQRATKILTMIGVHKCEFLAKSEN